MPFSNSVLGYGGIVVFCWVSFIFVPAVLGKLFVELHHSLVSVGFG